MKRVLLAGAIAAWLAAGGALAQTLRIGLQDDPDQLDPARSATFVGRIVFAGLCDKLVDIDRDLNIVPQLATEWSWSADNLALTMKLRGNAVYHDGEPIDAASVKANLERYKDAAYSSRKGELRPVKSIAVVDPQTVRIELSSPYAPLLSVLSDRAGMMLSPKAMQAAGDDKIAQNPVCSGPFKFAQRVAQERIVLDKFDKYWNAAAIHLDKIMYLPMPDSAVRLANLQSGQLEIVERLAATDVGAVKGDAKLRLAATPALGYYTMSINIANNADGPLAKSAKVREALELSIDREALNQVVFNGEFVPSNQPELPGTKYFNKAFPLPKRDAAKAKALLKEAGFTAPVPVTVLVVNNPVDQQVAQVIQSMAGEGGFDLKLQAIEQNTLIAAASKGDYQAAIVIWSGRADPDGNVSIWLACDGFLNWGKWCNPKADEALKNARSTPVEAERIKFYNEASTVYLTDRPHLFLYHPKWLWGTSAKVDGFQPYPDGIIRVQGLKLGS
jgi:peptide/nickel transport system substrate-binding protein